MTAEPNRTTHFLLTAASIWTGDLQVLGIYSSEEAARADAQWGRLAAAEASPVRFTISEWAGPDCMRSITSSPPFVTVDATAGWA